MIKQLAALALAATAAIAPAAQAGTMQDHQQLAAAIQANGVSFYINHPSCFTENAPMGWYSGRSRELVVCQDNATSETQVEWTANDLDTLRHEAQHMIQDCMVGTNHDHRLGSVYNKPLDLAAATLTREHIAHIIDTYREHGASDHVLVLELEAFSVAALNDPTEQIKDIRNYCF